MRSKCGYHSNTHSDFNFQIWYRYAPDTNAILILIQISTIRYILDTLQTWKPFYFSFRFNYHIHFRYTPNTEVIFSLMQIQVQICTIHGCHSVTYSDFSSPDTLQTRKSFCHLFRSQLQFRYTPDTEVILLLLQTSTSGYSPDTLQTRFPFCHLS